MSATIYTRVSNADQNDELQLREIQEYAQRQGWEIVDTYQDVISGAKASRRGLNRLITDAMARKFDCLLVWKLDRFGRSLVDCLNNILGAAADFERSLIHERTQGRLRYYRAVKMGKTVYSRSGKNLPVG